MYVYLFILMRMSVGTVICNLKAEYRSSRRKGHEGCCIFKYLSRADSRKPS